jgi:hypothetical protein
VRWDRHRAANPSAARTGPSRGIVMVPPPASRWESVKTFLYGVMVEVVDAIARPVFRLLHHRGPQ